MADAGNPWEPFVRDLQEQMQDQPQEILDQMVRVHAEHQRCVRSWQELHPGIPWQEGMLSSDEDESASDEDDMCRERLEAPEA